MAQLLTDAIYNKRDPRKLYYSFRVKLMVFMALTNCFLKKFMGFMRFSVFSYTIWIPMSYCTQSGLQLVFRSFKRTETFFS